MPPATTRRLPDRPAASTREARIAPPYIPSGPQPASAYERDYPDAREPITEPFDSDSDHAAPEEEIPESIEASEPDPIFTPEPEIEAVESVAAFASWDDEPENDEDDDEGTVEPAFGADTDEVLTELTRHAIETDRKEEFPLDAFIVPEQAQHLPTGLENAAPTPPPEHTPANTLAERLEKLSHRLRVEESDAIVRRLAGGDRLDALLAGLLAGYLAGKSEQH